MKQHTDLTKQSGSIPIATQNDQLTGLDSTEPRRVLCCGPSGCGKSYNFMLPNLLEAIERGEPIVATDPLGFLEEHASEAGRRKTMDTKLSELTHRVKARNIGIYSSSAPVRISQKKISVNGQPISTRC